MAYDKIDEEVVYHTAGAALPFVIKSILQSLLNDNFETSYETILKV